MVHDGYGHHGYSKGLENIISYCPLSTFLLLFVLPAALFPLNRQEKARK